MVDRIKILLKGDSETIRLWLSGDDNKWLFICVGTIIICSGIYGFSVGLWRSKLQAAYVAFKFPILIIFTVICNSLISWMFSQLNGLTISYKQSLVIILMSFTIASIILVSITPVSLFILYNTPTVHSDQKTVAVSIITITHVIIIALAGIIANLKFLQILIDLSTRKVAKRMLMFWLTINLFLGAQLSWNLRPFIGTPGLKVEFFRKDAFEGNFYEDVYYKIGRIIK